MSNGEPVVTGDGSAAPSIQLAPKGRRFASAIVDLLIVPIGLGIVAGLLLLALPEIVRNGILIAINIGWLLFRDLVFAPGRKMVGIRVANMEGGKITIGQAFIRNSLIMIPFVLLIGYIIEIIFVSTKGRRLADKWAGTQIIVG